MKKEYDLAWVYWNGMDRYNRIKKWDYWKWNENVLGLNLRLLKWNEKGVGIGLRMRPWN